VDETRSEKRRKVELDTPLDASIAKKKKDAACERITRKTTEACEAFKKIRVKT